MTIEMTVERESHIEGAFKGWTGRGEYELADGSRWQQVEYLYQYRYLVRPDARVVQRDGRQYLEVEGMEPPVEVRQAR